MGRDGSVECLVIVLWHEAVYIQRDIGNEGGREYMSVVEHSGIEEGFQYTSRAAGRGDDIYLVSTFLVGFEAGVAGIGQYFAGFDIGDDGGEVMDMVGAIFKGVTVDQLLCLFLQGVVYRSRDTCSGGKGGKPFQQVRGFVGQGDRGLR